MRFLIQVVNEAKVEVEGKVTGEINKGMLVFIGVSDSDTTEICDKMLKKMLALRIFEDENGKTNKSLADVNGGLLLVSQFTLYADVSHGNRPSFTSAGKPQLANELYEYIISKAREQVEEVGTGVFGADMKVSLINNGPFTIYMDSDELFAGK